MFKYFKKSITRQYVYYLIIVIIGALLGALLLTGVNFFVQDKYIKERDQLNEKHEIVNAIEDHFLRMVFHARGYFYLQGDIQELEAINNQQKFLEEQLDNLETLQLDEEESEFLRDFNEKYTDYQTTVLEPSIKFVQEGNIEGLKALAYSGARDRVTELVGYTQTFTKSIDMKLHHVNKNLTKVSELFNWIYVAYILLILLILGFFINRLSINLGRPLIDLTKASQQLVKGEFHNTSFEKREDEIGTLSNSFLEMARSIQNKEEELTAQNEELMAQQADLEEHQARLQASFEETEIRRQLSQDIIDHVNEGITLLDISGALLQYNEMFVEILGGEIDLQSNNDFEQWSALFKDRVDNFDGFIEFFKEAIANTDEKVLTYRYEIKTPANKIFDIYAVSMNRKEYRLGTLFVHRDITAEYEVDQMKSELVSTVSHELRTPLASVLGFAELMLTKDLKPERQKRYLETIHKEASRLTNLINDFLDIQRMESGKQIYEKKKIDLVALVKNIVTTFKTTNKQHQFIIETEKSNIFSLGDEEKLIQLFTNLISNAVKFSPNGGKVTIRLTCKDQLVCSVEDEGLGIPEDELSKLFQKFYRIDNSDRRKIGGTGLGLAISKKIVEAHNGVISVSSTLGQGSTFFVTLPLFHEKNKKVNLVELEDHDKPIVMIVEDDESLGMLLLDELKELDVEVKHYLDGESAISSVNEKNPDIIILDIMLGDKIDGWHVIEELKKSGKTKDIPIIISSALDEKERGVNLGVGHYLTKPYPHGKLTEVVLALLEKGRKTGEILIPVEEEKE